ncbi:MAG: type II toxin-antitoxin system prevent-host-death family antitoxin [Bryobacteraceae bacterium]|nr:type II toxin-antitoxin system prevent-host-death family antitoxin [Bryobacteraceae bacterium]
MDVITEISATEFKAKCLQLLDQVANLQTCVVVTKRGKPVARVVPLEQMPRKPLRGSGVGRETILGDLLDFDTATDWEVNQL